MSPSKKSQLLKTLMTKLQRSSNLGGDCTINADEATLILEIASRLARTVEVKNEKPRKKSKA